MTKILSILKLVWTVIKVLISKKSREEENYKKLKELRKQYEKLLKDWDVARSYDDWKQCNLIANQLFDIKERGERMARQLGTYFLD